MRTPLLALVAKLLFLPILVLSFAYLVKGYAGPGGGFAAGAIGGVAILLQRIVFGRAVAHDLLAARWRWRALAVGLLIVLGVALLPMAVGAPLLTHYPPAGAHVVRLGALELHTSLLFDVGIYILVLSFVLSVVELVAPGRGSQSP